MDHTLYAVLSKAMTPMNPMTFGNMKHPKEVCQWFFTRDNFKYHRVSSFHIPMLIN